MCNSHWRISYNITNFEDEVSEVRYVMLYVLGSCMTVIVCAVPPNYGHRDCRRTGARGGNLLLQETPLQPVGLGEATTQQAVGAVGAKAPGASSASPSAPSRQRRYPCTTYTGQRFWRITKLLLYLLFSYCTCCAVRLSVPFNVEEKIRLNE